MRVDAHGQEVARLLGKVTRMRRVGVGVMLGAAALLTLGAYLYLREPFVLMLGGLLNVTALLCVPVVLERSGETRKLLRESQGVQPEVAFHTRGGYFFINSLGVFSERHLGFIPFQGLMRVIGLSFDAEARKLTLRLESGFHRTARSEWHFDVPRDVPAEPFERLRDRLK